MKRNKTILAVALGALLASNVYAADNITPQLNSKTDAPNAQATAQSSANSGNNNNALTEIALQQKKLERENFVATQQLNLLKTKQQIQQLSEDSDFSSGSTVGSNSNAPKMSPSEEQRIAEEQGIQQEVGFVYKADAKKAKITEENTEINKVLSEFNDLKKKMEKNEQEATQVPVNARPQISIRSLESVELDGLSIYDESEKSAKIKFTYLINDGPNQKRVVSKVDIKENGTFKVQGDSYKVLQIRNDGVSIQNTVTQKNIELARVN
jgi:opacity protein-like surface antigen